MGGEGASFYQKSRFQDFRNFKKNLGSSKKRGRGERGGGNHYSFLFDKDRGAEGCVTSDNFENKYWESQCRIYLYPVSARQEGKKKEIHANGQKQAISA